MSTEDIKKEAAKKAMTLVGDKAIVGLGAGSSIGHVFQFLTHIAAIRRRTPYFVEFQNFQIPPGGLRIFFA